MRSILRAPHVRGFVPVPTDTDMDRLMFHILADLRRRECQVRISNGDALVVEQGTPGRGSVLAFVDGGGTIRLDRSAGLLRYDFPTAGGLLLCAILSPVCGGFAWFGLDGDPMLTTFAACNAGVVAVWRQLRTQLRSRAGLLGPAVPNGAGPTCRDRPSPRGRSSLAAEPQQAEHFGEHGEGVALSHTTTTSP